MEYMKYKEFYNINVSTNFFLNENDHYDAIGT